MIGFTDGQDIRMLMPSQGHKQLYDGDTGPNTGGMGATVLRDAFYNDALMASSGHDRDADPEGLAR